MIQLISIPDILAREEWTPSLIKRLLSRHRYELVRDDRSLPIPLYDITDVSEAQGIIAEELGKGRLRPTTDDVIATGQALSCYSLYGLNDWQVAGGDPSEEGSFDELLDSIWDIESIPDLYLCRILASRYGCFDLATGLVLKSKFWTDGSSRFLLRGNKIEILLLPENQKSQIEQAFQI